MLARPGVPLVYTPKSAFIMTVTAWDDRESAKFNEKPKQIIALEQFGGTPILGSGLTTTREEQIKWAAERGYGMFPAAGFNPAAVVVPAVVVLALAGGGFVLYRRRSATAGDRE